MAIRSTKTTRAKLALQFRARMAALTGAVLLALVAIGFARCGDWVQGVFARINSGHPILSLAMAPLVFMGVDFWTPLMDFMRNRLEAEKTIDPADLSRILVTDSPEQAVKHITDAATLHFGLSYGPRPKRRWFLWE